MSEETQLDPKHTTTRQILRKLGPVLVGVGLLFVLIGFGSFFAALGSFEPPRYFWCAFLGMPILFVGIVLCSFAYRGAIFRYQVGEIAPVAKDTFNYLAEGTQEGMKTVATSIGAGIAAGMSGAGTAANRCSKCRHGNDADAKFCKNCGAALAE